MVNYNKIDNLQGDKQLSDQRVEKNSGDILMQSDKRAQYLSTFPHWLAHSI